MKVTARRCPKCGGQVEVASPGTAWHRSDCPNLDRSLFPVEEVEVVPVERCVTADCGRAAARLVFIEEAEPPGWFSYCEQCAAELNGEAWTWSGSEPVRDDDPIIHGARWRQERDEARQQLAGVVEDAEALAHAVSASLTHGEQSPLAAALSAYLRRHPWSDL